MDNIYKNIEVHNPNKKRKILLVFGDMVSDILSNKNINPIDIYQRLKAKCFSLSHNLILLYQKILD